ncbi:OpgC domain-containing protein [uncultured Williamsia sp.]|uniref:OpgC domain-containing protein n=1 Tax=uncultured Williamsia sp. TaxID=259311 RepID=UPI0026390DB1|nr:OpgC domain-containing protein [uncultured Williamsia sp.]
MANQRETALDVVRGLCIASMVIGHLCIGSPLWMLVHIVPGVDGASGFVLLAGVVLGMVSSRRARLSVAEAERRVGRRLLLLYVAHVSLAGTAVVAGLLAPRDSLPDLEAFSASRIAGWLLTLQINPENIDILSLYVILMALTMLWVPLLARGWWHVVVASSAALYVLSLVTDWGRLPDQPHPQTYFAWASWQALYCSGLLVGWHWQRVAPVLQSRRARVVATVTFVVLFAVHAIALLIGVVDPLFGKTYCAPGRIVLAWAVITLLYHLARRLERTRPRLVAPVATIGSRSLACFITLCALGIAIPYAIGTDQTTLVAQIVAVAAVVAMWPVARIRGTLGTHLTRARTSTVQRVIPSRDRTPTG